MALERKLLIIPCCKAKNGIGGQIASHPIDQFISFKTAGLLKDARRAAFERPGTSLDRNSKPVPALYLYSGNLYSVEGFREAVKRAVEKGMHVLVESGGYGLIRIEEPICSYEAQMNTTSRVWRKLLPTILSEYIRTNRIEDIFIAGSEQYMSLLRKPFWWEPAKCHWFLSKAEDGAGSKYQVVGRNIGVAVRELIQGGFRPDSRWLTAPPRLSTRLRRPAHSRASD